MSMKNKTMMDNVLELTKISDRRKLFSEYLAKSVLPIIINRNKGDMEKTIKDFKKFSLLFPENIIRFSYIEESIRFIEYSYRRLKRENKKRLQKDKESKPKVNQTLKE